ncbi:efflux RND transporter permease subunit [Neopusillimonas aromaticivorans]|uniref:efflux RND transporter permease subunit n=1 Tax=Neopusillimonas aromaticivorans TaxID=2979868 RepID=UPI003D9DE30C
MIQAISQADQTVSFSAMSRLQLQAAHIIAEDPDVDTVTSFTGVDGTNTTLNTGRLQIALKPLAQRADNAQAIIARLQQRLQAVSGLEVFMQPVQDLTIDDKVSRTQYQFTLSDPDPAVLETWVLRLVDALQAQSGLADVTDDLQNRGLQTLLSINRDTASRVGVTLSAVNEALYDALGQRQISTIFTQSAQYRVVLEVAPEYRQDPAALDFIHVQTADGGTVPLTSLVTVSQTSTLLSVGRQDQFPAATVSFNLPKGVALSDAVDAIQQVYATLDLPASVELRFQGAARAFEASLSSTLWLMLAAVVAMYIVLGVLYESYIHPVTILSTLPSATVGALLALLLTGKDLDMIGVIGIILLIGIVKKNAIMMIDFALDAERSRGLTPLQAIHEAALLRFRPILMTTLAALFSAIPLMLATGAGSELRQPLGLVMVGGLICSQLLTLFTTPVIYLMFDRLSQRWRALRREVAA